ncbi:trehalase-like [Dreissena polymorpha]|nr:trehalase-like [Dreissena polymorpha]XP_052235535.1 trehalase-like [Dreissena polymorpha]
MADISQGRNSNSAFSQSPQTATGMANRKFWSTLLLLLLIPEMYAEPACDSDIWCHGPLLNAVQTAGLFKDSKTFVDMPLKVDPETMMNAFNSLNSSVKENSSELRAFVDRFFDLPGSELVTWEPEDAVENPAFLRFVRDPVYRQFGKDMCSMWKHLGRKIKRNVKDHPERYSLIYMEHPFIVPGGRFRETYYWDSFWVVKGLLSCEMTHTVKGMLQNFLSLITRYGMIPNGSRMYYTKRSQPPFFIPMVQLYLHATNDTEFIRSNIDIIEKEYLFWNTNRTVDFQYGGKSVTLNRYATPIDEPRPESYREDKETARRASDRAPPEVYTNLASAAESGWDFSSRWFSSSYNETFNKTMWLTYIDTTDVVPVDLNSVLCWNEHILEGFFAMLGNHNKSAEYASERSARMRTMSEVFWNSRAGQWFDVSIKGRHQRQSFYPSNLFPLFTGCFETNKGLENVLNYLKGRNLLNFISGVPTSRVNTGQQWDFPNAWPPLIDAVTTALERINVKSREAALNLADQWVKSNYVGWQRKKKMFEKYVVTDYGSRGSGGEYDVQEGFGWTNGVVLDLLRRYGKQLTYHADHVANSATWKETSSIACALYGILHAIL